MKLVDAETMRALDGAAISRYGVSGLILMENAGRGVFESALKMLVDAGGKRVSVIAGKGNNGGDGFVAARHLKNSGFEVRVFFHSSGERFYGRRFSKRNYLEEDGRRYFGYTECGCA